jgi:amidase
MSELHFLPAATMAELVRQKRLSPVELVEAHLARIHKLNPKLNAIVHLDEERALRDARAAEAAVGKGSLGPLHGVPLTVKSSIDVAGLRCEAGTRLRAGHVAAQDAPLVTRLRSAGAIILGVTNAPELLMAWETDSPLYGRTNNPWDLARTPGGSSGGEAAAIASGCSAGGVGSDGGGSIREPAHFSGICGLKPTPGRIPCTGHYPGSSGPFARLGVVGPMARTIGDLKLLFEVMQGFDDGDPSAAPVPLHWPRKEDLRRTRVGYFEEDGRTPVTSETRAAVRAAAEALRCAGFHVEPFRPEGLEDARELWWKLFGIAGGMLIRAMFDGREEEVGPLLQQYLDWTLAEPIHSGQGLLDTWVASDEIRLRILAQMREYPILLCPVAAIPAFRHGERSWRVEGREVRYLDAWSYTEWFNLLGMPAAVVPVGASPEGLPIGVQIAGRPWEEEIVLEIAAEVEAQCQGWRKPPEP